MDLPWDGHRDYWSGYHLHRNKVCAALLQHNFSPATNALPSAMTSFPSTFTPPKPPPSLFPLFFSPPLPHPPPHGSPSLLFPSLHPVFPSSSPMVSELWLIRRLSVGVITAVPAQTSGVASALLQVSFQAGSTIALAIQSGLLTVYPGSIGNWANVQVS